MSLSVGIGMSLSKIRNVFRFGNLTDINASANEIAANAAGGAAVSGITWSHNLSGSVGFWLTDDAGGRFVINAVTGQLQRSAYGVLGESHTVTVRAEDDLGRSATADVAITVTSGTAPQITSNGGGSVANISITEGGTAITTVQASGQAVTFSVSGTDSDDVVIDANTGVLAFDPAPDYSSPADSNTDNVYEFTVTATDGVRSDTQDFTVTVTTESGLGSVPGTEIGMRTGTSSTGTTWTDASGTYGQSATGTDWWELEHDGSTEGYLYTSKSSAFTGLAETYFVAMEVKPISGETVQPSMNVSGGPFPAADITTSPSSPTIAAGTGGVRADGLGQFTVWMELPADASAENLYLHMANNGDLSPSGADALSGQGFLIGAIWFEAKGVKSEPTQVVV